MVRSVPLTADQQALRGELVRQLGEIAALRTSAGTVGPDVLKNLGRTAHELHLSLAGGGHEPRHHKYMRENRGCEPSDPKFYEHVHPVEDLLKFIENRSANDDPEDRTIGAQFTFPVYSRRWGHKDAYKVTRTKTGWRFSNGMAYDLATGHDGRVLSRPGTGLFAILDHDSINYPGALPGYLGYLWERAAEDGLGPDEVQRALDELAEWVSTVESGSPTGAFGSYK